MNHERAPATDVTRLFRIHGRYYDLDPYLRKHPGGDVIEFGRGKDCTELWESVHCLTDVPSRMLKRFAVTVGEAEEAKLRAARPIFLWEEDGFYRTLQKRVRAQFGGDPARAKAPRAFYVRWALFFALWMVAVYRGLWSGSLAWAALGGFMMEVLDLTVTHDGSHNAISRRPFVNKLASYTQYLYFWGHPIWFHHHVYAHHSYTGVEGLDPDLENNPLQRKHTATPLRFWHRLQALLTWLYLPWLMSVVQSLNYLMAALFRLPVFGVPFRLTRRDWFHALGLWSISLVVHFVVPFWLLPWHQALMAIATYYVCQSLLYFMTVAPNHDIYETVRQGDASLTVAQLQAQPMDWGEKQVRGTANFMVINDTCSRLLNPLLGGIHYQIEHHLFPAVSHCHYPALAAIVQETCAEFGIPYQRRTWLRTLVDYQKALRYLARPETPSTAAR